jgi:N,N-dimethylformamidase beta subunit-like protein
MAFIEGYADQTSLCPGETLRFHVSTDAPAFRIAITREGLDRGIVHQVDEVAGQEHPVPETAYADGCGWPASYQLEVPASWRSGVYRARLSVLVPRGAFTRWCDQTAEHSVFFVIRADQPGANAKILMQLCTNTYAAYNFWGGRSLYAYHSRERLRASRVSLDRPGLGYYGHCTFDRWERPFVEWAEAREIPLEYACNYDLEAHPEILSHYRLILGVDHDEYWSGAMRRNAEAYLADGGNFALFSGNSVCWQVRFEAAGRCMRCHKEVTDDDPAYMAGQLRDLTARFNASEIGWPENSFTGLGWDQGGYHLSHGQHMDGSGAYTVRQADHWVFEGTGLRDGDTFGGEHTIVGYETDGCLYEERDRRPYPTGADGTPRDLEILAQAPASVRTGHQGCATIGFYQHQGAFFNAGTTDWSHGLADPVVDRITRNVLSRLSEG